MKLCIHTFRPIGATRLFELIVVMQHQRWIIVACSADDTLGNVVNAVMGAQAAMTPDDPPPIGDLSLHNLVYDPVKNAFSAAAFYDKDGHVTVARCEMSAVIPIGMLYDDLQRAVAAHTDEKLNTFVHHHKEGD